MKILVVEPGQIPYETEILQSLGAMQALVGGTIQAVYPFPESVALVCNDEGKMLGLPLNRTLCDWETGEPYDIVAGTFFSAALLRTATILSPCPRKRSAYCKNVFVSRKSLSC